MNKEKFNLNDLFERGPERRIELIGGKMLVGGSLDGSRALLGFLLASWGLEAGIALLEDPQKVLVALDSSKRKNEDVELPVFEPRPWREVSNLRQNITFGLFRAAPNLEVYGRDIVMRLGDDAFTPDSFVFRRERCPMTEYFLDGAAEICMEFLPLPNVERYLSAYLAGGVKECWLFDTNVRSLTVYEAVNREWQTVFSGTDGIVNSRAIPGISVVLPDVWDDRQSDAVRYSGENRGQTKIPNKKGTEWGDLIFEPRINLDPTPIGFDEFISWSPESKFESYDNRLIIGSEEGSRNVIGLLLMTLGLRSAVALFSPDEWRRAIDLRVRETKRDAEMREQMLTAARRAAEIVKESFKAERVALYGDYFSPVPINFWSRVSLVYWGERKGAFEAWHEVYRAIDKECGKNVDVKEFDSLTKAEQKQVEKNHLML